jgi:hypothetical protein
MMQPHLVIKSEAMDLQYAPAATSSIGAQQKAAASKKQPKPPKAPKNSTPTAAAAVNKKRQKKKQELFDDDFSDTDDDDEDDFLSEDGSEDGGRIKTEPYDMDSDSEMPTRTKSRQNLVGSVGSNVSYGSSYMNSESLFDLMMSSKNRDAYFWQYNTQSKGPKTKKVLTLRNKDPHLHRDFYDPVFQLQSLNAKAGSGLNKLRKGDGNDVTPNPEKLYNLGNQIRDFIQKSYQINNACLTQQQQQQQQQTGVFSGAGTPIHGHLMMDNQPVLSSSFPVEKVNLKREKNKIASRACRLKKKAQHEANKIKLFGLNEEHSESLNNNYIYFQVYFCIHSIKMFSLCYRAIDKLYKLGERLDQDEASRATAIARRQDNGRHD